MGYRCYCGEIISDTVYPCPHVGNLRWQTESETASQDSSEALEEFFKAVENGTKNEWLKKFFDMGQSRIITLDSSSDGERTRTVEQSVIDFYLTADIATVVSDIVSRYDYKKGHSVYRCPECERIYIQKEYRSDEYECYEKLTDYSHI